MLSDLVQFESGVWSRWPCGGQSIGGGKRWHWAVNDEKWFQKYFAEIHVSVTVNAIMQFKIYKISNVINFNASFTKYCHLKQLNLAQTYHNIQTIHLDNIVCMFLQLYTCMYQLICIQNMPVNNYYIFNRHYYADTHIYLQAVKHIYLSNMQSVAKPINTTCISNN